MKAGTSSLGVDLGRHPEIYVAPNELHFFNSDGNYNKGISEYLKHFSYCSEKAIGEKTPSYSYHPLVPERIAQHFPKIRLIWILRDPIERAYSHYQFFVQKGIEKSPFEKAIKRETNGLNSKYFLNYLDRSIYINQINRYLQYFPIEQMCFIDYSKYIRSTPETLREICLFLNVDPNYKFNVSAAKKNVTKLPFSKNLQFALRRAMNKFKGGHYLFKQLQLLNQRKVSGYPPIPEKVKGDLKKFYTPYNNELNEKIGLNFND
ncbi:MAG: sulfotransferase [Cyclobacteriaceae bacterium]